MSAPLPSDLNRVDPNLAWQPWMPGAEQPFDAKWAGHLIRRAAFGANPDEVRKAVRDGFDETLRRLLAGDDRADSRLTFLDNIGEHIVRSDEPNELRAWWLSAMLKGGHPLREKMVLFWHGHFATSIAKVRSTSLMFRQNQLLRGKALGKFAPLLAGISRDSAMLLWLDSNENVKAHPNENYAREVMELFTLGVGNYTEKDVREAARAFTGWHVSADDGFELNAAEHDDGPKSFLNKSGQWNGDDILRILLEQPACARFLTAKLYRHFVSETEPPKALLEPLADQLRRTDYDIGACVQTILQSRIFFSDHAYCKRIKSPVEFVVGAVRAAWPGPFAFEELVGALELLGQSLFAPPNVKGWTGGKNWLNDATLLARCNFAAKVAGEFPSPAPVIPSLPELPTLPASPKVPSPPDTDKSSKNLNAGSESTVKTSFQPAAWDVAGAPAATYSPGTNSMWYVQKMKAQSPVMIARAVGEQFFSGGLPDRVNSRLERFLGKTDAIVPDDRIREVIHAVMCLPEYQLC